jgi:hypothetical protein
MSRLVQYRGIRRAVIVFADLDTGNLGKLGPDPRGYASGNIWILADEDVREVARGAMKARPPKPNENVLYLTIVSQDPIPIVAEQLAASGYHYEFEENGTAVRYGVLLNQSAISAEQTWDYLPGVFSHELVESCTDPDTRTGFFLNRIVDTIEICDINDTRSVQLPNFEKEVKLAAYWSGLEDIPVVPTTYSLRVALGKRPDDAVASIKAALGGNSSIRSFILAGCNS